MILNREINHIDATNMVENYKKVLSLLDEASFIEKAATAAYLGSGKPYVCPYTGQHNTSLDLSLYPAYSTAVGHVMFLEEALEYCRTGIRQHATDIENFTGFSL